MGFFEKFQNGLEKVMNPIAGWMNKNRVLKSLTAGFMNTMPISLGVAIISILANLPFEGYQKLLTDFGILPVMQDFILATSSLLAVPMVVAIAYHYTDDQGESGIIGGLLSLAAFIVLMPIQKPEVDGVAVNMFQLNYMGADGMFVAILVGVLIPMIYCKLMKRQLKLKLPSTVPPMVSDSLSPLFVSMIIFFSVFMVKYLLTLTPYGHIFGIVGELITKPVSLFGGSPWALVGIFVFQNLLWFFGIHPAPVLNAYMPIVVQVLTANGMAFMNGEELPNLTFHAIYIAGVLVGGNGNTLGLCIATLFARSEKYKQLRKVVIPANLFNINEPIIFGFPLMMNPLYFVPMVFSSVVSGAVGIFLVGSGIFPVHLNPTIAFPWITPIFITCFVQGGMWLLLLCLINIALHFIMYLPFFLLDDSNAYKEEQGMLEAQTAS